ncbi:MAG: heavy metal sensor histidine kinase [Pseudomonadota bacterium]
MMLRKPTSLAARLALWFAVATFLTFAVVGSYLYRSLAGQLEYRDDHELLGKIEQFRHILLEMPNTQAIIAEQYRFNDAATGHEGLIVILRAADGSVLLRNHREATGAPDMLITPADAVPGHETLRAWTFMPGQTARAVSAWGKLRDSSQQVQIIVARTGSARTALLTIYLRDILGAILVGALLSALLGFLIVQRGLRPVRAIAGQASAITAQRLGQRLDATTAPSELHALVESFNAMLDRLQESFQRLSQFSADLAHDLRTPLYNLTMQTQVMLSQPRSNDEYQSLLLSGLEEYERLTRMLESMLFLARADNAHVPATRVTLDAVNELQKVADYFEGVAEESGVKIVVQGSGSVTADPTLLRRAVNNLVANAIRYTASGDAIYLEAHESPTQTCICVVNPGIGIAPVHLPRLFDRFYRVDAARSQSASSTGLGLAIVQSIMKLHGGSAEVTSVENGNTRFSLLFPSNIAKP